MLLFKLISNIRNIFVFIVLFSTVNSISSKETDILRQRVDYYKQRYGDKCLQEKITDNFGNGFEDLYGTRNLRPVIHGIVYRGGANNYYHKLNKRKNSNPLPMDGLIHLAKEGFSSAVYLYAKNFNENDSLILSGSDTLRYYNNTLDNKKDIREMLELVKSVFDHPEKGPVYLHCWNGWHQSGYASALVLMQFCGFSNSEAAEYWRSCADGGTKGYEHIIRKIMKFKPFPDLKVKPDGKEYFCPCNEN